LFSSYLLPRGWLVCSALLTVLMSV